MPVGDEAAEEIRPAQEGRIVHRRPAEDDVVPAAGAGVAPVEHELLAREAREARGLVEVRGVRDELAPARGGVDVDLDHAGIGRDAQPRDAGIARGS